MVELVYIAYDLRPFAEDMGNHGKDFPGETFRVLKEKEVKQFGEFG